MRTTVTYGTADSPAGIAFKTTREERVTDAFGNAVMERRYVCTDASAPTYAEVFWAVSTYNIEHKPLNTYNSRHEETNTVWNCCRRESYTAADGTQYTYTYDALQRLVAETKIGHGGQPDLVTSYTYDSNYKMLTRTVTGGELSLSEAWTYDYAGRVPGHTATTGAVTAYAYAGAVTTVTGPDGTTTISTNYGDGSPQSLTGTAVVAKYYNYGTVPTGGSWMEERVAAADGPRFQKRYQSLDGKTVKTEQSGFNGVVTTEYSYNAQNQLVKQTKTGTADLLIAYDELGRQVRVGADLDGNGTLDLTGSDLIFDTEYAFEQDAGNAWWQTTTQKTYAATGSATPTTFKTEKQRLSGFAANVAAENQSIDIYGNVTTTTTTLDRANKTVTASSLSPASTVAEQQVKVNGLVTSTRSTSNLTATYSYNGLGMPVGVTDPRTGTTAIAYYDETGKKGLKASVTDPANNVTTFDYDTAGRLLWQRNALNQYTRYAYNTRGDVTAIWGDTQYPITLGYDNYGQQTTLTTYRNTAADFAGTVFPTVTGDTTTWTYDAASGLVTAKTDAASHATAYTYTVNGNLATRTWARGIVTTYTFNALNKPIGIDYSDTTPDITIDYNRLLQPLTVTDAVGSRTFSYDANLALTTEVINGIYNKTLTRSYATTGLKGRYTGMNIGTEYNTTYGYDDYGRLNQVNDTTFGRVTNSDLLGTVTRPNNVNTAWSYEAARNLVSEVNNGAAGALSYLNNAIGNRTSMTRGSEVLSYTYDNRSEVTGATSSTDTNYVYGYNYDPIGNRLTANLAGTNYSYTANSLNQYSLMNATVPTYDVDGNMLTNGSWTYTWNGENRLISATDGTKTLTLAYDYAGRRISKQVSEGATSSAHIRFVYDKYKLIEELDALNSNVLLRQYAWQSDDPGLDVPLTLKIGDNVYYYHTDANKNIIALTDSTGNVVNTYRYSPFGQVVASTGTIENPFQFSSEYYDEETGLVYYNYRYYNPQLGRWLSRDPIEERGGVNVYATCWNNCILFFDCQGEAVVTLLIIGGVAIIGATSITIFTETDWGADSLSPAQRSMLDKYIEAIKKCSHSMGYAELNNLMDSLNITSIFERGKPDGTDDTSLTRNGVGGFSRRLILSADFFDPDRSVESRLKTLIHEAYHSGTGDYTESMSYAFADRIMNAPQFRCCLKKAGIDLE